MCDDRQPLDLAALELSRRRFAVLGLATALASCAPMQGRGQARLAEADVSIPTPDGSMDGFFVYPTSTKSAAVILWPDVAGRRPANMTMARRLAAQGFAVLVANPYYRSAPAPQFPDFATFREQGGFAKAREWRAEFSPDSIAKDTKALVAWLDAQPAVDTSRRIGVEGYCMTGSFALLGAAAVSDRIGAAASFHGGGLVRDNDASPHLTLTNPNVAYLIAIAQDDDAEAPDVKTQLRAITQANGVPAEIEVYAGDHGWTVLDSTAYAEPAAERAFGRKVALYRRALG